MRSLNYYVRLRSMKELLLCIVLNNLKCAVQVIFKEHRMTTMTNLKARETYSSISIQNFSNFALNLWKKGILLTTNLSSDAFATRTLTGN